MPVTANHRSLVVGVAVFLLAGIGGARIISTYKVFSQTSDEPAHLITGMEWLQRGTYTFEPLHPPLARVAVALGPYLSGSRLTDRQNMWEEGNAILLNGRYLHNLSLARLGVLPFFMAATFFVWYWARAYYGDVPALVATLLFTTSPVVLAHAGVATTDMAIAATFMGALICYVYLLQRPTYFRSALFGLAAGLAALSKFSALVFLPACGLALLTWRWFLTRNDKESAIPGQFRWTKGLALAALVMFLVIWAGYRFSVASVTTAAARPHPTLDHLFGATGNIHDWAYSVAESPWVPAPAFFRGLAEVRQKDVSGAKGYLLGHVRQTGWWYFFPVALAVKTTLPFLVLVGVGSFCLVRSAWRERNWIAGAPFIAALALLLVCMPSQINIGVRHILPIYPLFAVIGGLGTYWLWNVTWPKYAGPVVVLILLSWHLVSSVRAHPDYLAYFNELAGPHPETILVDSDLDWGQDLLRLSAALQEKHVEEVSIAYAGSAGLDLHHFGLPPFRILNPHQPTTGWIAISLLRLKAGGLGVPSDAFSWLNSYQPVCPVGRSIRLYYVPDGPLGESGPIISNVQSRNSP